MSRLLVVSDFKLKPKIAGVGFAAVNLLLALQNSIVYLKNFCFC